MKLLKSEKHRTEKASMIYNWLRTLPWHVCEFRRCGFPRLRQERQREHVSPISPQTRQDTKGTWQAQVGTRSPFMHGTLLNRAPQQVHWALLEPFPALLSVPQTCKDLPVLCKAYSSAPHCCSAWTLSIYCSVRVSIPPRNHTEAEDVAWKKVMLPIIYAMAWLEPHKAPNDAHASSKNFLLLDSYNLYLVFPA